MLDDLLNSPSPSSQGKTRQIKKWVRQHLALSDDITVMVSELHCGETDCPDIETMIAILSGDKTGQKIKIDKSISELSESDIVDLKMSRY